MSLAVADAVWLNARVGAREGWIHRQEDCQAIGLPPPGSYILDWIVDPRVVGSNPIAHPNYFWFR